MIDNCLTNVEWKPVDFGLWVNDSQLVIYKSVVYKSGAMTAVNNSPEILPRRLTDEHVELLLPVSSWSSVVPPKLFLIFSVSVDAEDVVEEEDSENTLRFSLVGDLSSTLTSFVRSEMLCTILGGGGGSLSSVYK